MSGNFRRHLVGLSLLVGVAVQGTAIAEAPISNVGSGSIDDRVTSLERISNAHSQLLTQLQQQISDSQRDIDSLRGQIQENQYQLSQLADRQKQLFQQLQSASGSGAAGSSGASSSSDAASTSDTSAGAGQSSAAPASAGDENSDYNAAASLALDKKQSDNAIAAFQGFIKQYPKSTYVPNANFWLGQLYYNKGKKDDAAYYFAYVVKNYGKSPKSSEAMLKVGVIMEEKGDSDKAKAVFQQVIKQYPGTDAAKQAQRRLSAQ
jgi:tol-pal system protein YbgF